ncbi:MAG: hypothetical protein ACREFC_00210 [Stellaceae bacterium]
MLRSKLTLGAALIGAGLLAGCAYEPAPGYYSYNQGYYADPGNYSYDPAYYSYGYNPGYYDYGYGYGYGPAFYGYYDGGHHWHNRGDRDWNRADWQRFHRDNRHDGNRNNVNARPRENFSHSTAPAPRETFQRGNQAPTQLGNRGMQQGGGDRGDRRDMNH